MSSEHAGGPSTIGEAEDAAGGALSVAAAEAAGGGMVDAEATGFVLDEEGASCFGFCLQAWGHEAARRASATSHLRWEPQAMVGAT